MRGQIGKWGNSLALRIPTSVARDADVLEGKQVDISVETGRIVITPLETPPKYDLDALLAGITPDNLHAEIPTGGAVGNETP